MATLNMLLDGSIEEWSSGSPANQNVQTTTTTLQQLTRLMVQQQHPASLVMRNVLGHWEPLVKDGQSALRATLAASTAADAFRIWSPGASCVAALTGATTNPLIVDGRTPGRFFFSFWSRCNVDFNSLRVRLYARDAADAQQGSFTGHRGPAANPDPGLDGTLRYVDAVYSYNTVEMRPFWKKHGFAFEVPAADPNGGQLEHLVWQISNDSASAQDGVQIIDIDDIQFGSLKAGEEVALHGN